ncbi:MAG: histidinol dehydrogenase, partial [Anaerolineales bacterium]|nr:histidinol dehydrogenase [Anaerolineales bacterium]
MIKLYTVREAQQTILRREMALEPAIPAGLQASLNRLFGDGATPDEAVRRILRDVRQQGDTALRDWTKQIDRVQVASLQVGQEEITAALGRIPGELVAALQTAVTRIRAFHEKQPLPNWTTNELGGTLGQRVTPIARVGVYVPGGTAPLPSSLLMSVIPAQVAGVPDIVVATPPGKDGRVNDVILAAAALCGIDTVYTLGGAQAIAALAFGTESVRRVDKIVGAGGLFTTLAKR